MLHLSYEKSGEVLILELEKYQITPTEDYKRKELKK